MMTLHFSPSTAPVGRCLCCVLLLLSVGLASPAVAAFTPVSVDRGGNYEPNLIGLNPYPGSANPSVIQTLYGEENVRRVIDEYDRVFVFTEDEATFKVVARFSAYPSYSLSVANPDLQKTDPVLSVTSPDYGYDLQPPTEFVVRKEDYVAELRLVFGPFLSDPDFVLRIPNGTGIPGRDLRIDNMGVDQMVTFKVVGNQGHPDNPVGSYVLAWEDRYRGSSSDSDFQDFVVEVTGIAPVPEPASVALILLAAGAALVGVARRRR